MQLIKALLLFQAVKYNVHQIISRCIVLVSKGQTHFAHVFILSDTTRQMLVYEDLSVCT